MHQNGFEAISKPSVDWNRRPGWVRTFDRSLAVLRGPRGVPGTASRNFGLDMIRAAAIGLVLVSHYGGIVTWNLWGTVPLGIYLPGYFGVELFFVLSGFLIGGLLLKIADDGMSPAAWRRFMVRRLMRTLPAYFVWMIVAFLAPHPPMTTWDVLSYVLLIQNFAWPMLSDYCYSVTWSLTIEEWFYFLFSASVLVMFALRWKAPIITAVVCFIAIPTIVRICVPSDLPWDAFVRKVVLTRLDAIAFGVMLALIHRRVRLSLRASVAACLCGASLLSAIIVYWLAWVGQWDIQFSFLRSAIFSLTSIGFAAMFPLAIRATYRGAWMRSLVMTLSTLSYSLYLVHLTILRALWPWIEPRGILSVTIGVLGLVASFVVAFILHAVVEAPMIALRPAQIGAPKA